MRDTPSEGAPPGRRHGRQRPASTVASPGRSALSVPKANRKQHRGFIEQVQVRPGLYAETIEWFKALPLWLVLDGIRVVHACWNSEEIERVNQWVPPGKPMSTEFVVRANQTGTPEYKAVEILLKGPEISLTKYGQLGFKDKSGHVRHHARIRWWNSEATTLRELAEIPRDALAEDGTIYPCSVGVGPPDCRGRSAQVSSTRADVGGR